MIRLVLKSRLSLVLAVLMPVGLSAQSTSPTIPHETNVSNTGQLIPGAVWLDTKGEPTQAHGGGVLFHEGFYYWYGENKNGPTSHDGGCGARTPVLGISAYKSKDLITWENLGVVLQPVPEDPSHDLHTDNVLERPKVIYNASTKSFVMWMHVDHKKYTHARAGVAVAVSPAGPFTYLGAVRPDGQESRDMTLFKDDDGSAWLIYSSDGNSTLRIAPLSADYRSVAGSSTRHFPKRFMEAPVIFKRREKYYLIASGCSCWAPNTARSAVADAITGPWKELDNPCIGPEADKTFRSQGTFVIPVQGRPDAFIFMADRWDTSDLSASRYIWLPIEFRRDGGLRIEWQDRWDLSFFDRREPKSR